MTKKGDVLAGPIESALPADRDQRRKKLARVHFNEDTHRDWVTDEGIVLKVTDRRIRSDGYLQVSIEAYYGYEKLPWDTDRQDNPIILLDPQFQVSKQVDAETVESVEDVVGGFRQQIERVVVGAIKERGWQL